MKFLALCAALAFAEPSRVHAAPLAIEAAGAYAGYNVIIISLGNVGAKHMSLYGYARKTTPLLERWSRRAVVFENAFAPASWTLPVAASLFTSLYPYSHGIVNRYPENALDAAIKTLPEVLRAKGYRTAAFTGGLDYDKSFSTMRGFEEISSNKNFSGFETTIPQAQDWLKAHSRRKFFLFIHGYDAHCPFTPAAFARGTFSRLDREGVTVDSTQCVRGTWQQKHGVFETWYPGDCDRTPTDPCQPPTRRMVNFTRADIETLQDLYDEEVLTEDRRVGEFLASLNKSLLSRTIVVVMGDHGEMFAKHGRFGRAGATRGTLYDDVIHIPLVIRLPRAEGQRVPGLVEVTDIAPTLAGFLGVALPHHVQGKDLAPLIRMGTALHAFVFAGLQFYKGVPPYPLLSVNESVRSAEWKLIHEVIVPSPGPWKRFRNKVYSLLGLAKPPQETYELYHLPSDPEELTDLSASQPAQKHRLMQELRNWAERTQPDSSRPRATQSVPARLLREAREHGYW